jgi:hypothetical protein
MSFVQDLSYGGFGSPVTGGDERAAPTPVRRDRARVVITQVGGAGSKVRAAAAVGGASAVVVVVSLQGRPGRRMAVDVGWDACGAPVGFAAAAIAASTRGRHMVRLRAPGCRPLGLVRLMS